MGTDTASIQGPVRYDFGVGAGVGLIGVSGRGSTGVVNDRFTNVAISAAIFGFSDAA